MLLVVVRVHTWSDVCPVCGRMRNTGSLYVLHAPRLPKSSLLRYSCHTYIYARHTRACFAYVCSRVRVRVRMRMRDVRASGGIESRTSCRERHFMGLCCLHGRRRSDWASLKKLWNLVAHGSLGTLINRRLKWLCITWTCVSRAWMDGELRDKFRSSSIRNVARCAALLDSRAKLGISEVIRTTN